MQPILIVIGTRPEGIKMIPVYHALKHAGLAVQLCSTSQHDQLLSQVFELFGIKPDFELHIMKPGQDLFYITQAVLEKVKEVLLRVQPSMVLVQGDTTSAMAAALAAFYLHIKIGHVEAGLRTNDLYSPFPEEMNRRFISLLAAYHFAPTAAAAAHVLAQGVHRDAVFCTGNTVVDALHSIQEKISQSVVVLSPVIQEKIQIAKSRNYKVVLLTIHRRESFDGGIMRVLSQIKKALEKYKDLMIIYPHHPNPQVLEAITDADIQEHERFFITSAMDYHDLVYVLGACDWVMTDSGGIQEEATSIGKPVIVLRDHTERVEGVWAGLALLVGTDAERIKESIEKMMLGHDLPRKRPGLYGDGHAAEKIARIIAEQLEPLRYNRVEKEVNI